MPNAGVTDRERVAAAVGGNRSGARVIEFPSRAAPPDICRSCGSHGARYSLCDECRRWLWLLRPTACNS
jgi:hypothetical protein